MLTKTLIKHTPVEFSSFRSVNYLPCGKTFLFTMRSLTRVTATSNDHFFEFPKPSLPTALTVYHYLDFYGNGYCTLRNEVASKSVRFMRVFLYTFLNTAVNKKSSINRLLGLMLHLSLLYCFLPNNLLLSLFPLFNSYQGSFSSIKCFGQGNKYPYPSGGMSRKYSSVQTSTIADSDL